MYSKRYIISLRSRVREYHNKILDQEYIKVYIIHVVPSKQKGQSTYRNYFFCKTRLSKFLYTFAFFVFLEKKKTDFVGQNKTVFV